MPVKNSTVFLSSSPGPTGFKLSRRYKWHSLKPTSLAPENGCLGDDPFILRRPYFQGQTLSFREGRLKKSCQDTSDSFGWISWELTALSPLTVWFVTKRWWDYDTTSNKSAGLVSYKTIQEQYNIYIYMYIINVTNIYENYVISDLLPFASRLLSKDT